MGLFADGAAFTPLALEDAEVAWLADCPLPCPSAELFARLQAETPWRQESIILFGKRVLQPRLSAWYGSAAYTYSGLTLEPLPLTPLLAALHQQVEQVSGHHFNSVLLNYYRDGRDSMGMHSDDEPELGPQPVIASLSLGATRPFVMQHKYNKRIVRLNLTDGGLLLMAGSTQHYWLHGINKTSKPIGARINLTFRKIS